MKTLTLPLATLLLTCTWQSASEAQLRFPLSDARNFGGNVDLGQVVQTVQQLLPPARVDNGWGGQDPENCPVNPGPGYGQPPYQPQPIVNPQPIANPAPAPAPVNPELQEARRLTSLAKNQFRVGEYEKSLVQLDRLVKLLPEDSDAYQFRGMAHFAKGDYTDAASDAYDALRFGNSWTWKAVNDVYANSISSYTQQLRSLEGFAKANPESMEAQFLLAYHYLLLNHLDHVERQLNKVLAISPEEPLSQKLLVVVQDLNQQKRKAEQANAGAK